MTGTLIVVALVVMSFLFSWRVGMDEPVDGVDTVEGFFEENDFGND